MSYGHKEFDRLRSQEIRGLRHGSLHRSGRLKIHFPA